MKKLTMDIDDLQVESFPTERDTVPEDEGGVKAFYGPNHTETTCKERLCGCSAYFTDCDYTCPNYWNADYASCEPFVC
ncbi:MAG TPA: hypothetical protein VHG08_00900 [Longimicrobium sp.]|nr:hypothetical protein [Longimicrobium sp.]